MGPAVGYSFTGSAHSLAVRNFSDFHNFTGSRTKPFLRPRTGTSVSSSPPHNPTPIAWVRSCLR